VAGRRGRRRKELLDDLKEKRGHWKLKEEALDRTVFGTRLVRGCGPVVRHPTEWVRSERAHSTDVFVAPQILARLKL